MIAVTKRTRVQLGDTVGLHVSDEHIHLIDPGAAQGHEVEEPA